MGGHHHRAKFRVIGADCCGSTAVECMECYGVPPDRCPSFHYDDGPSGNFGKGRQRVGGLHRLRNAYPVPDHRSRRRFAVLQPYSSSKWSWTENLIPFRSTASSSFPAKHAFFHSFFNVTLTSVRVRPVFRWSNERSLFGQTCIIISPFSYTGKTVPTHWCLKKWRNCSHLNAVLLARKEREL